MQIKPLTTLVAVSALLGSTAAYAARADFLCRSEFNTCYFTILYTTGGVRNFTMRGGERDTIGGVQVGDQYCFNYTVPNNPNTCPRYSISVY